MGLERVNELVFITEAESVYWAVRTEALHKRVNLINNGHACLLTNGKWLGSVVQVSH
jgi:hypothetical protein